MLLNKRVLLPVVLMLCFFLPACASKKAGAPEEMTASVPAADQALYPHREVVANELDDYDHAPAQIIADPLEPWNRFWFHFNDVFFLYVAKPLYKGYDFIMPREFQSGLKNFLTNMLFPVRFVNSLLQGKFKGAGVEFGRFIVNSTVGFGGFIDAAKGRKAVVDVDPAGEDLGQTLGYWGFGQGFYIVWPIIGPSSARDTVGLAGDVFLNPSFYLHARDVAMVGNATLRFNTLGDILPMYENVTEVAVDPYVAMREAYAAFRKLHVQK